MLAPLMLKQSRKSKTVNAVGNTKSLFMLLVEFDQDFGCFPNDQTADADVNLKEYKGKYSNDYLGQFIAGGYTASEEIFAANYDSSDRYKADNNISTREETLKEGECSYAYIKDLSTESNTGISILLAPMYGDGLKFDPFIFDNKCVVLRIDGSVKLFRLNDDRHALVAGGKTLFEGGADTVWGDEGFDQTNLHYAKYPYTPVYRPSNEKTTKGGIVLLICLGLLLVSLVALFVRKHRKLKVKKSEIKPKNM